MVLVLKLLSLDDLNIAAKSYISANIATQLHKYNYHERH